MHTRSTIYKLNQNSFCNIWRNHQLDVTPELEFMLRIRVHADAAPVKNVNDEDDVMFSCLNVGVYKTINLRTSSTVYAANTTRRWVALDMEGLAEFLGRHHFSICTRRCSERNQWTGALVNWQWIWRIMMIEHQRKIGKKTENKQTTQ